jgi:peptidoglycan/xylan/chitin deacetylase (PgdA/CDA1 family)
MAGASLFRPVVLCYHAAAASWHHVLSTEPALIERQVKAVLRSGFRAATSAEVAARPDAPLLHVTFDDAYRSVADAVDVLAKLGVPATVFVCTAFADAGGVTAIPELAKDAARHPEELATMGWDELRALAARGVEIGSHTVSHPHLPELSTDEIRRELVESRRRIEAEIGKPCRTLAYPYGEHDERCRALTRAAGYELGFTAPPFRSSAAGLRADSYALPRVSLFRNSGTVRTKLKASLAVRRLAGLGLGSGPAPGVVQRRPAPAAL